MKTILTLFFTLITTVIIAQDKFKNYYENGNILFEGEFVNGRLGEKGKIYKQNGNIQHLKKKNEETKK